MKKFFFYSSIIILCILIWYNKKIIEGHKNKGYDGKNAINKREYKNVFGAMSIADLRDIYDTIEHSKKSNPSNKEIKNADNNENANNNNVLCFNSKRVLKRLRALNINNDAFNNLLISTDDTADDVYNKLIKKLKKLKYIEYKKFCDATNKNKRVKGNQKEICSNFPKCDCLDQELCNNYTYLNTMYEAESDASLFAFITTEPNIIYSKLLKQKLPVTVDELDKFKQDTLSNYFLPIVSSK
jgi:hypothetical protein